MYCGLKPLVALSVEDAGEMQAQKLSVPLGEVEVYEADTLEAVALICL